MTISRVRETYQVIKNNEGMFSWLDEEVYDLITAIAEHILKNPLPSPEKVSKIPKGYITVTEFGNLFPLFSEATIFRRCHLDSLRNYSVKVRHKNQDVWFIQPERMLEVLQKNAKGYQRRMNLMDRMKN